MAEIKTKQELLDKLRAYASTPDDENIRYKNTIKNTLLSCPELLYALHEAVLIQNYLILMEQLIMTANGIYTLEKQVTSVPIFTFPKLRIQLNIMYVIK